MASLYNVTDILTHMNASDDVENFTSTTPGKFHGRLGYGELELYTEFWVAFYLNRYYLRILCGVGVVCNVAVFLTMYAIKPFTTSSFYVSFLAVVDALALITKLLYIELTRKLSLGDAGCKFMLFFGNFTVQYANWVLVIMTLERFVAVWFPLKVNRISTMNKAKVTLFVTALLLTAFNLHFLWTFQGQPRCRPKPEYAKFMATVWPWLDGLVFGIAPCVLLIVPNGLIIYSLRRAVAAQKTMTSGTENGAQSRYHHQTQLTAMLVTVAVAFVCCLLPGSIFSIVKPYWDYKQSVHQTAQYQLINQLMFFLADCNHALNFFFFFLGGKRFRQMFIDVICCRRTAQKQKKFQSTYVSQLSVTTPSSSHLSVSTN
ncbi:rhodopsin-like [Liolophura sinensis]|uniref:rhodopsin-like n=1 Tax=Liolophura sinensis TaxID=3198878 RepID=UPI003158CEE1